MYFHVLEIDPNDKTYNFLHFITCGSWQRVMSILSIFWSSKISRNLVISDDWTLVQILVKPEAFFPSVMYTVDIVQRYQIWFGPEIKCWEHKEFALILNVWCGWAFFKRMQNFRKKETGKMQHIVPHLICTLIRKSQAPCKIYPIFLRVAKAPEIF